jgi:hypothetical protein
MTSSSQTAYIEIEAKFQGGQQECDRIVGWLEGQGFKIERKEPVHRVHVYFDDQDCLRNGGCRLRCVIAPGEWCRYDFKADDPSGRGETTEVSLKRLQPIPLAEAVSGLAASLQETPAKRALLELKDTARVLLVMTGRHLKVIAVKDGLKLEISWDVLVPLETGVQLSEIEIELLDGPRTDFDTCVAKLAAALGLSRSGGSKLEMALADLKNSVKCDRI